MCDNTKACQATEPRELMKKLLDPSIPKSELEHFSVRYIQSLLETIDKHVDKLCKHYDLFLRKQNSDKIGHCPHNSTVDYDDDFKCRCDKFTMKGLFYLTKVLTSGANISASDRIMTDEQLIDLHDDIRDGVSMIVRTDHYEEMEATNKRLTGAFEKYTKQLRYLCAGALPTNERMNIVFKIVILMEKAISSKPVCPDRAWNICPRCKVKMTDGQALIEELDGYPDFIGDDTVCTLSASGRAKLIDCIKCPECGFSRTKGQPDKDGG